MVTFYPKLRAAIPASDGGIDARHQAPNARLGGVRRPLPDAVVELAGPAPKRRSTATGVAGI